MISIPRKSVPTKNTIHVDFKESNSCGTPSQADAPDGPADRPRGFLRHVAPTAQLPFTWILMLFSCAFFILTIYYAFHTRLFGLNPSNSILIIRVLSGVTTFLISALVVSSFDRGRWMLVRRKKGAKMLDFLTLSSGTGIMGWWTVLFARNGTFISSRVWSFVR